MDRKVGDLEGLPEGVMYPWGHVVMYPGTRNSSPGYLPLDFSEQTLRWPGPQFSLQGSRGCCILAGPVCWTEAQTGKVAVPRQVRIPGATAARAVCPPASRPRDLCPLHPSVGEVAPFLHPAPDHPSSWGPAPPWDLQTRRTTGTQVGPGRLRAIVPSADPELLAASAPRAPPLVLVRFHCRGGVTPEAVTSSHQGATW